ncbi:Down syndrome cell adhesion molecule [Nymphon striatum]|nr:Down syndrome cell adhesion molecule [Nymphon striatum]
MANSCCFMLYSFSNKFVKPVVAKIYVPEHVRVGMQVGLYCSVLEGNRPMTKKWLKNGKEISVKTDIVIMETSGSSVLEIKKVNRHHNGNYTCLVQNEAGSSSYSATLKVEASLSQQSLKYFYHELTVLFSEHVDDTEMPSVMQTANSDQRLYCFEAESFDGEVDDAKELKKSGASKKE